MGDPGSEVVDPAALRGAWRRSLLRGEDGVEDVTTDVLWLQGPIDFADLRQPVSSAPMSAHCLRALSEAEVASLACQQGFAGTLVRHSDHFEWVRLIDFQPKAMHRDLGTLKRANGMLVEEGYEIAYVEHWHRHDEVTSPATSLWLVDTTTDGAAMLLRVGRRFAFARSRTVATDADRTLIALVERAPHLEAMQDLVDCEISLGFSDGWRVERSTLPWRVGETLAPERSGGALLTSDIDPWGAPIRRRWTITDEGRFAAT